MVFIHHHHHQDFDDVLSRTATEPRVRFSAITLLFRIALGNQICLFIERMWLDDVNNYIVKPHFF